MQCGASWRVQATCRSVEVYKKWWAYFESVSLACCCQDLQVCIPVKIRLCIVCQTAFVCCILCNHPVDYLMYQRRAHSSIQSPDKFWTNFTSLGTKWSLQSWLEWSLRLDVSSPTRMSSVILIMMGQIQTLWENKYIEKPFENSALDASITLHCRDHVH